MYVTTILGLVNYTVASCPQNANVITKIFNMVINYAVAIVTAAVTRFPFSIVTAL